MTSMKSSSGRPTLKTYPKKQHSYHQINIQQQQQQLRESDNEDEEENQPKTASITIQLSSSSSLSPKPPPQRLTPPNRSTASMMRKCGSLPSLFAQQATTNDEESVEESEMKRDVVVTKRDMETQTTIEISDSASDVMSTSSSSSSSSSSSPSSYRYCRNCFQKSHHLNSDSGIESDHQG